MKLSDNCDSFVFALNISDQRSRNFAFIATPAKHDPSESMIVCSVIFSLCAFHLLLFVFLFLGVQLCKLWNAFHVELRVRVSEALCCNKRRVPEFVLCILVIPRCCSPKRVECNTMPSLPQQGPSTPLRIPVPSNISGTGHYRYSSRGLSIH